MAQFKVTETDGEVCTIDARRMTSDGQHLWFHDLTGRGAGWKAVARVELEQIEHVMRRVTEASGVMRWLSQPVAAADEPTGRSA